MSRETFPLGPRRFSGTGVRIVAHTTSCGCVRHTAARPRAHRPRAAAMMSSRAATWAANAARPRGVAA